MAEINLFKIIDKLKDHQKINWSCGTDFADIDDLHSEFYNKLENAINVLVFQASYGSLNCICFFLNLFFFFLFKI